MSRPAGALSWLVGLAARWLPGWRFFSALADRRRQRRAVQAQEDRLARLGARARDGPG